MLRKHVSGFLRAADASISIGASLMHMDPHTMCQQSTKTRAGRGWHSVSDRESTNPPDLCSAINTTTAHGKIKFYFPLPEDLDHTWRLREREDTIMSFFLPFSLGVVQAALDSLSKSRSKRSPCVGASPQETLNGYQACFDRQKLLNMALFPPPIPTGVIGKAMCMHDGDQGSERATAVRLARRQRAHTKVDKLAKLLL